MKDEIAGTIYAKDYTDWMVKTGGFARDMTLRDHFAGLAMQGNIASMVEGQEFDPSMGAEWAYKVADAMLKERAK
jgi:hypothetical protein